MLNYPNELNGDSLQDLDFVASKLCGFSLSPPLLPGATSGLINLPHQFFPPTEYLNDCLDTLPSSPSLLPDNASGGVALQPSSHRRLLRENSSAVLTKDELEGRSGVWTVGESGQVSVDYLIDGGSFQGELAVFSLQGMEKLQPGSPAFTQEAARRALSQSVFGQVVISDAAEGARFDGSPGESSNWNAGQYRGVKTYKMRPGDRFGLMLVPNVSVQSVLEARVTRLSHPAPLFSVAIANRGQTNYLAQLDDAGLAAPDDGGVFVMEDTPAQRGSTADFNDLIFQVAGATATAPRYETLIQPQNDWRHDLLPLMAAPSALAANASGPVASSNLKRLANTIRPLRK